MTPNDGHQLAGLGYTEEQRYIDYLQREREIELKTAKLNAMRVEVDGLKRTHATEEKAILSWLRTQPDMRKAITLAVDEGELEIGAMVKVDETAKVEVYMGGMRLRKAVEKAQLGSEFLSDAAFPQRKRGRKETTEDTGEPDDRTLTERLTDSADGVTPDAGETLDEARTRNTERRKVAAANMRAAQEAAKAAVAGTDPLQANGRGKAGRPEWSPPAEPAKDPAFDAAWESSAPADAPA